MHLNHNPTYEIPQYLKAMFEKKPVIMDKEYQAVIFFNNDYKFQYLSSNDNPYNYFIYLNGKISILDGYIYMYDQSLGHIILEKKNIISIEYKDEIRYTYLLIKIDDTSKFPLTNIVKNEILIYISSSSIRSYKADLYNSLKSDYNKVETFKTDQQDFYSKLAYLMYENEKENINYISNSFFLEKTKQILIQNLGYENLYLRLKNCGKEFSFEEYNQIKRLSQAENKNSTKISNLSQVNTESKRIKIVFVIGNINSSFEIFSEYILDTAKSIDKNCSLFKAKRYEQNLIKAYTDFLGLSANSKLDKSFNKTLIIPVGLEINIPTLLHTIADNFGGFTKFFEIFEITNICFAINYSCFLRNKNNDLFNILGHIKHEELCKFLLIDESNVSKRKVDRFNAIIQLTNKNCTFFNKRSFTRNSKEVKKIITDSYFNEKYLIKLFSLGIFNIDNNKLISEEQFFFKTEFYAKRNLLEDLVTKFLNVHFNPKNARDKIKKKEEVKAYDNYTNKYMNNFDFQDELLGKIFLS